jgi:hypothetical protein
MNKERNLLIDRAPRGRDPCGCELKNSTDGVFHHLPWWRDCGAVVDPADLAPVAALAGPAKMRAQHTRAFAGRSLCAAQGCLLPNDARFVAARVRRFKGFRWKARSDGDAE